MFNPTQAIADLAENWEENWDHSINEDGETSLIAAAYDWVCICGALNTINGRSPEVTCGWGSKYGEPHEWRPAINPCGLTFKVDTGDINDAFE